MLDKYFESYRTSALRDLLPEFSDEAHKIPVFNFRSSLFEYLQDITNQIRDAIATNNHALFFDMLLEHQAAAIEVQKAVVRKYDSPMRHGWRSFKFSDIEVQYDKFIVLPRITCKTSSAKPVIYADEMQKITDGNAERVLQTKTRKPCWIKVMPTGSFVSVDLDSVNEGTVNDWTARLKI